MGGRHKGYKYMNKQMLHKFNHDFFLLGRNIDGEEVWLQDFSWDCDWYWGGGYLEVFNLGKTDISQHYHFDGMVNNSGKNAFDAFKEHFTETVLTDDEIWVLCDLLMSFYAIREAAAVVGRGGSHYITHNKMTERPKMASELNSIIGKEIAPAIRALLDEK